jgi:transcriptional regulator with XRE-family HTH domain
MGQRILARRKALGLTQDDLAEKIGVTPPMISNLEQGKKAIRPDNLAKVCKALDVSTDFILYGSNSDSRINDVVEKLPHLTDAELQVVSDMIDALNKNRT